MAHSSVNRFLFKVSCVFITGFVILALQEFKTEMPVFKVEPDGNKLADGDGGKGVMVQKEATEEENQGKEEPHLRHISSVYNMILEDRVLQGDEQLARLLNISSGSTHRKNVLFIMSDDLRPQLGSYWGRHYPNPFTDLRPHTPHLDRLASSSLLLTRAYVQYSICGPSRASLLTGRRPDTVTTWRLDTQFRKVGRNFTTLPQYFKENDYVSINLGKIFHDGHGWKNDPISWHILGEHNPTGDAYFTKIAPRGRMAGSITAADREGNILSMDESDTRSAVNYLRRLAPYAKSGRANFFLAVGYHRPHLPWICSQEYFDLFPIEDIDVPSEANKRYPKNYPTQVRFPHAELLRTVLNKTDVAEEEILSDADTKYYRRAYFACTSFVDDMVGILLDEVERLGLTNSTIVVFMGDHGFHLGENSIWGKCSNFELSNRTPLMMKIPGLTDNGIVSDSVVEFVDIFPTLVEAVGFPPIPSCPTQSRQVSICTDGESFMSLIKHPQDVLKPAAISQMYYNKKMGYSIKTHKYRYTEWVPMNKTEVDTNIYDYFLDWDNVADLELYDHENDPEENINLAYKERYKDVVNENRKILRKLTPNAIRDVNVKLF